MKRGSYREPDYTFGQLMLTLRSRTGLIQAELGKVLGVSRRAIADWEAGKKYPKAEHLQAFISFALQHHVFQTGNEENEIRDLWKASGQKILIDETWLTAITHKETKEAALSKRTQLPRYVRLPVPPTEFVGRVNEVAEIIRILNSPSTRLLTLLGPGGIGKTRLALEVASQMTDLFADGVVFVPLASISSTGQIVSTIGEMLEWVYSGQKEPTLSLLEYLRDLKLLLILDNFEHLLSGVGVVSDIIRHAPQVTILTTSRERLNLQAEWLVDVEGLSYPSETDIVEDPERLSQYTAVELFVQRATQIQPRFRVLPSNFAVIMRICQQVSGMPLAIELAAASVRMLTVFQIETQLRLNLTALNANLHDMPPRHRSMRAVFEQSWDLLDTSEQILFRRLAVFRGGFGLEALEKVTAASSETLMSLIDKSLVRQSSLEKEEQDAVAREEARFRLLEPIREYAFEKLRQTGELLSVEDAHARYYLSVAEAAADQWYDANSDMEIRRLRQELDNLRAALQWARDSGDVTIGLHLCVALTRFWRTRGYIGEGRIWLTELLAQADNRTDSSAHSAQLRALHAAALLATDEHDFLQAEHFTERRLALLRAAGEQEDITPLQTTIALQARVMGDYQRSTRLLKEVVERLCAVGDRGSLSTGGLGFAIYFLAMVLREQGDFRQAEVLFNQCLDFHAQIGERTGVAQGLLGLSDIARDQGDVTKTRHYGDQCMVIFREFGTQWAIGFVLNNSAWAAFIEGDLTKAHAYSSESVKMFRTLQAEGGLTEVLITFSHILCAQAEFTAAQDAVMESLRLAWATGPRLMVIQGLEALAGVTARLRHDTLAVQALSVAAQLRLQMGTPIRPADEPLIAQTISILYESFTAEQFDAMWSKANEDGLKKLLYSTSWEQPGSGLPSI